MDDKLLLLKILGIPKYCNIICSEGFDTILRENGFNVRYNAINKALNDCWNSSP